MLPHIAAFDFSQMITDGTTAFNSIFTAVANNPLMIGVVGFTVVVSMIALVWGIFR